MFNKLTMIKFLSIRPNAVFLTRSCSGKAASKVETEENEDTTPVALVQDDIDLQEERRKKLEKIRNKSRLWPAHRNMLMDEVPYPEGAESWIHNTLKYKRKIFGKYGLDSGIDPRLCYPTATEQAESDEYERVAYPFTLQEMQKMNAEARQAKKDAIMKREAEVGKKLEKLDSWIKEMNDRIAKKEADARAARERKERLVEEVRRHFGYKVDMRDEKFKEMLAQKEKEDKKAQKEARRKQKEMKMLEKLITKGKAASDDVTKTEKTDEEPKTS